MPVADRRVLDRIAGRTLGPCLHGPLDGRPPQPDAADDEQGRTTPPGPRSRRRPRRPPRVGWKLRPWGVATRRSTSAPVDLTRARPWRPGAGPALRANRPGTPRSARRSRPSLRRTPSGSSSPSWSPTQPFQPKLMRPDDRVDQAAVAEDVDHAAVGGGTGHEAVDAAPSGSRRPLRRRRTWNRG